MGPAIGQTAGAPQSEELRTLQATYIESVARIETRFREESMDWPGRYREGLRLLQKKMQAAGDFDGWNAVQKETDRYAREKTVPRDNFTDSPAELGELQKRLLEAQRAHSLQKSRDILELTSRYTERLEQLRSDLTREGDMTAALAVDKEIKTVRESPRVTAAEFEVSILSGGKDEPKTEPAEGQEPEQGEEDESAAPKEKQEEVRAPGVVVHEPGKKPPKMEGLTPKRLMLGRTDHTPVITPVSIDAWRGGSSDKPPLIRLGVRSRTTDTVIPKLYVVLEYYTTPEHKVRRVRPERSASRYMILKDVSSNQYHLDFHPLSWFWARDRSSLTYWERHVFERGYDLYGVIVSAYDKDGKLIYQGASPRQLKEAARVERADRIKEEEERLAVDVAREAADEARDAFFRGRGGDARQRWEALRKVLQDKERRFKRDRARRFKEGQRDGE